MAKRARTSASASFAQLVLQKASNEDMNDELMDGSPKLWLHDLAQCLQSLGQVLREAGGEEPRVDVLSQSLRRAANLALKFCFSGEVTLNGKLLNKWSSVRAAIKADIVNDHLSLLKSVCGVDHVESATSEEITQNILKVLRKHDDGDQQINDEDDEQQRAIELRPELQEELDCLLTQSVVMKSVEFLDTNSLKSKSEFCAGFQKITKSLCSQFHAHAPSQSMSVQDVMQRIGSEVFDSVPVVMQRVACFLLEAMPGKMSFDVGEISKGMFQDAEQIERFLKLRCTWMLDLVQLTMTGPTRVVSTDKTQR